MPFPSVRSLSIREDDRERLRILCLHGEAESPQIFERSIEALFSRDARLRPHLELSYVEGPVPIDVMAVDAQAKVRKLLHGGELKAWHGYKEPGGFREEWPELYQAVQHAGDHVVETGPYDGLCGFGQGGEVAALLAKVAEEGDVDLQGQFRFVLCFSSVWSRGVEWRPQAPLTLPLCHVYETNGRYSPADYEHFSVHWRPEVRTLIPHQEGYVVPDLEGEGASTLRHFLMGFIGADAVCKTSTLETVVGDFSDEGDRCGHVLPMVREPSPILPSGRVGAVCFHDMRPAREATPLVFDGLAALVAQRTCFQRRLALDAPELSRYVILDGILPEAVEGAAPPRLAPHHALPTRVLAAADMVVEGFAQSEYGRMPVAIVGYGFGAYVGLLYAQVLREIGKILRFEIDKQPVLARIAAWRPPTKGASGRPSYRLERCEAIGGLPGKTRWAELDEEAMCLDDDLGNASVPYRVVEGGGFPWKLYAVRPPSVFPSLPPGGALGNTAVCCFLDGDDPGGERWRFEAATRGDFQVRLLGEADNWAEEIVRELQQEVERANPPVRR